MARRSTTLRLIYAAMAGNCLVAVTKFVAGTWTGGSAIIAEGVHSLVDTGNQALLLYGLRRAERRPTPELAERRTDNRERRVPQSRPTMMACRSLDERLAVSYPVESEFSGLKGTHPARARFAVGLVRMRTIELWIVA
jgi:Cation efflux family